MHVQKCAHFKREKLQQIAITCFQLDFQCHDHYITARCCCCFCDIFSILKLILETLDLHFFSIFLMLCFAVLSSAARCKSQIGQCYHKCLPAAFVTSCIDVCRLIFRCQGDLPSLHSHLRAYAMYMHLQCIALHIQHDISTSTIRMLYICFLLFCLCPTYKFNGDSRILFLIFFYV